MWRHSDPLIYIMYFIYTAYGVEGNNTNPHVAANIGIRSSPMYTQHKDGDNTCTITAVKISWYSFVQFHN